MASDPKAKGDELGRTTTEAASATAPAGLAAPLGASVGRYRLERELGAGGMGVVHAAFDPDLERRIALKVLRVAAPGTEAKDRLLREARAMARLAHPNVVTVHEVGTTNGRDFIAMELIHGETLADWLRSAKRQPVEIIAAFLAAGRGLAAAHAAGIVHRDFKPHNVLRNRDGRIVVTDFGLAREAQADLPIQLDVTLPLATGAMGSTSSTPLTGITVTGSLLGTPAYMAPEQWSGGVVTPATDQFAYCVALWEALAGERPYRGPTLDDLRAQAALGPAALDARNIPRRLRAILRRGLDPDPARRWANMDALLARIVRVERRPGVALAIGGGALVVAAVVVGALRASHDEAGAPRCDAPLLAPAQVWSRAAHAEVGTQTAASAALDAEIAAWEAARSAACNAAPIVRAPRLSCLDGVLARIAVVARAARANREGPQIDAGALLIDPQVCDLSRAPRLMVATSQEFRDVATTWLSHTATPVPLTSAAASSLVARATSDPCASSLAHLLAAGIQRGTAERTHHLDEAQQEAERCGDDRVVAETALAAAQHAMNNEWLSATVTTKLRLAEAAVLRVAQRDLVAAIDLMRVETAKRAENLEEAIARGTAAMDGFAARGRLRAQISAGLTVLDLRQIRASDADLAAIPGTLAAWRARAVAELGEADESVRSLDTRSAHWAFSHGDVAGAHASFDRLWRPLPNEKSQQVAGTVVDVHGKPVAGATVTAGRGMYGDSAGAAIPGRGSVRVTRSGPDGRFEIPDAVEDAVVIAELGDRRSSATELGRDLKLKLAPTSRLEGRVELAGEAPVNVTIAVEDLTQPPAMRYVLIAPVASDGTFALDGIPRRAIRVFAQIEGLHSRVLAATDVVVRRPVERGIAISLAKSTRVVHVLVRSTVDIRLANAQVIVLAGKVASANALVMNQEFRGGSSRLARQLDGVHAPKQIVGAARLGDLFVTMTEVPEHDTTACALGLPGLSDAEMERKVLAHLDKLQVICAPIPDGAELVEIEVPPLPRLD